MLRDPIRIGSSGVLRVQFLDSNQEPVQATSVTVDLFAPGLDPDIDPPTITGLVPTYIGDGVFELTLTPSTPEGFWIDRWTGNILGTVSSSNARYSVVGSGVSIPYPVHGLQNNTLVEVVLSTDITSLSGNSLSEDFSLLFTTTYSPLYSSVRKVRLDAGGAIAGIDDDTINLAILEASIEADVLSFNKHVINNNLYLHARRQYVTCLAALGLLQNSIAANTTKRKQLADFNVEYDHTAIQGLLDKINACLLKWGAQLQTGGGARSIGAPRMVVKGETDPDRPAIGRLWYRVQQGELPIGNQKYKNQYSRRFKTGWLPRPRNPWGGSEW